MCSSKNLTFCNMVIVVIILLYGQRKSNKYCRDLLPLYKARFGPVTQAGFVGTGAMFLLFRSTEFKFIPQRYNADHLQRFQLEKNCMYMQRQLLRPTYSTCCLYFSSDFTLSLFSHILVAHIYNIMKMFTFCLYFDFEGVHFLVHPISYFIYSNILTLIAFECNFRSFNVVFDCS